MSQQSAALLSALIVIAAALCFDAYCLKNLARAEEVFYFPPRTWSYIIVLSTPFGGFAYLLLGRR